VGKKPDYIGLLLLTTETLCFKPVLCFRLWKTESKLKMVSSVGCGQVCTRIKMAMTTSHSMAGKLQLIGQSCCLGLQHTSLILDIPFMDSWHWSKQGTADQYHNEHTTGSSIWLIMVTSFFEVFFFFPSLY